MTTTGNDLWSTGCVPRLVVSRHVASGELTFPPLHSTSPLAAAHQPVEVETQGRVYSFTVIHPGAKSGQAPYAMGFVDLPGPVRIFGRLQGSARPQIGDRCVATPDATFGYVFEINPNGAQA